MIKKKMSLSITIFVIFALTTFSNTNFLLSTKVFNSNLFDNINPIRNSTELYGNKYSLSSDEDKINIVLLFPSNNSINKGNTNIIIDLLDINGSQVSPTSELYRWDYDSNYESILRPLPMGDGEHTLNVEVESKSGIWSTATYVFYTDDTPPSITLTSPENKTHVRGGTSNNIWSSTYPSGSLITIEESDINNDGTSEILIGGSDGYFYIYGGEEGDLLAISPLFSAAVTSIQTFNDSSIMIGLSNGRFIVLDSDAASVWSNSTITSKIISLDKDPTSETLVVLNEHELRTFNYTGSVFWNVSFSASDYKNLLLLCDVFGNSTPEIIVINQSSFVEIYDLFNGSLLLNFTVQGFTHDAFINSGYLYTSTSSGYVYKCNITSGAINWSRNIEAGQNIYRIEQINSNFLCTTGNGKLILLNETGNILYNLQITLDDIKHLEVYDFDKNSKMEALTLDGGGIIRNIDVSSGSSNWNLSTSDFFTNLLVSDFNNDTFYEAAISTSNGKISVVDVREQIPFLTPSWTNISILFNDDISNDAMFWEKYSWDGLPNQSYINRIPSSSGIHTLDVWACDNASNVAHAKYRFFAVIESILNFPNNGSRQQTGTEINLTFSEAPIEALYKWDNDDYSPTLAPLPSPETSHNLYVKLKDQSYNLRVFHFEFISDDTPVAFIFLQTPTNDTLVEGGEEVIIQFSEDPVYEFYSWNNEENSTNISQIPQLSDTHTLNVFFADAAMNWKQATFVFHTKIKISLNSHENNSIIDPYSILYFTFGENPDIYEYRFNSDSFIHLTDHNTTFNVSIPNKSQTHTLEIRANDSSNGIWNIEKYVFKTKLVVTLMSHENNGFAETGDPIIMNFSDIPITKLFSWDDKKNSSRNPVFPGPDGPHTLNIYLGNVEGDFWSYHYEFNVDTDLIDILLITPTNNTRVNSWDNLTLTFSENPHQKIFQWDDSTPTTNLTGFPTIDGGHTLNVTVLDKASNTNKKTFYWIIDDIPINVSLIGISNNSQVYSSESLNLSYNNETPYIEWYKWDSNSYSPSLPPTPYGNGTHVLNVTVSDGLNWNKIYFYFNVTDLPPILKIVDPYKPFKSGTQLTINKTEELSSSWHKWDNQTTIDGLNVFVPQIEDGVHNLTIYAEDLGHSSSLFKFVITIDNTPIEIISISPKNNSNNLFGGENISIDFSETPFSITYSWDNGGRTNHLKSVPNTEGAHVLSIIGFDEAGNKLDTNILYKIPSEGDRAVVPIISLFGVSCIIATLGFLNREKIGNFLKSRLKRPVQPDD